jgi:hypothetical protein
MTTSTVLDAGFISRELLVPRSQDFAYLRRRGLRFIEKLANRHWTDYNVHDPGITILEVACYAITDVALRAGYPMRDLLAGPLSGGAPAAPDFHLAHEVLVSRPVTFDDLRRLLIDIPGVRNAWVERHRGVRYGLDVAHDTLVDDTTADAIEVNGLYDVYLEYEESVADTAPVFRNRTRAGLFDTAENGDYVGAYHRGLEFEVRETAQLVSVDVFAEAAGTVVIRLLHGETEVARTEAAVATPQTATTVSLNYPLEAGRVYRLDGTDSTIKMHRTKQVRYPLDAADAPVRILRGYAPGPTPASGSTSYYFFYNWAVSHDSAGLTKGEVRAAAVERIHANRNLCEDVVNVCDLVQEDVAICAEIELRPDADTDAVHAEILYRLHHHVSPAVPFHSLDELLARGRTVDEIFDGPLLGHGFIDEDELEAIRRKCEIRASDIVQILMDVEGVVAVRSLKLLKQSDPEHPQEWILPLSADRFRIAVFRAFPLASDSLNFGSKLIFYKRGLPYYTNRKRVEPLFNQKKAADIEAKLKVRQRELSVPAGEWRNPGDYEPMQNELPGTYCVGRVRVPATDPVRQAQSRQLKAYLLLFDQLLANYLAQLSHVGDLFSWRGATVSTYFTQPVTGILDFEALDNSAQRGHASFADALRAIVETQPVAEERRLGMLRHLAARYAEEFEEYTALMRALGRSVLQDVPARLIAHMRSFLDDYPALSAGRGAAFDWRWPDVPSNIAGYQRRVYRLIDIEPVERRHLAGHRFNIVDVGTPGAPSWRFELVDEAGDVLFESITCETRVAIEALLDVALRLGGDAASYEETATGTHTLVQRCAEDETPDAIGATTDGTSLDDVTAYFHQYAWSEGFHLIEHLLLRRRTTADPYLPVQLHAADDCCPTVRDPYSFRVSIVLPSWSPRFRDMKFRRLVEDTLRREAPAHVYPRICWVNHQQMKQLEIALDDWQPRLAAIARDAGACGAGDGYTRTGRMPLPAPPPAPPQTADHEYAASLRRLAEVLYSLTNVYPLAQLHDCEEADGDTPQVTLGNTNLGTL